MKKKRFVVAVVALVLTLGGVGAMWFYAQGADERAMAGLEAIDVFYSAADIPAGTSLEAAYTSQLLMVQRIPKRLAPPGASVEINSTNSGYVALSDIRPGELVLLARFGPAETMVSGLSIPPGLVAVSVQLSDPQRVGNFLNVGSKVAIFDTYQTSDKDPERRPNAAPPNLKATRLLLKDILVLAVGATTGRTSTGQAAAPSALLTVAVTQAQAETLIHGITTGSLYLALMNDQSGVTATKGVDDKSLFGQA